MTVLTKSQSKRLALRSIRRLERDIQPGIRRVSRAWRRLRAGLVEDVISGEPILGRVQNAFRAQTPTLAGAIRLAYLQGVQHVLTVARPHMPQQFALYDRAVADLEARLGMDAAGRAALAVQTGEKAARILTLTGTALEKRLRGAMLDVAGRELTLGAAKKELRRAIADTGLGPEKTYQLEAIFRTQTQISYNAGRWDALQDEAIQDVLWGYEYATVGDDRVRDSHAELDGTRLPKDDPTWTTIWPPNGWNCRCTTLELFEPEPIKRAGSKWWIPDEGFLFDPRTTYTLPGRPAAMPKVPVPGVFAPVKTIKAAENELIARKLVTGTVDYSQTTIEVANMINQELIERVSGESNKLVMVGPINKVQKVLGEAPLDQSKRMMRVSKRGDKVYFGYSNVHAKSIATMEKACADLRTVNLMAGVTPRGVAVHETGHVLDQLRGRVYPGSPSSQLNSAWIAKYRPYGADRGSEIVRAKKILAGKIGTYSLTDDREHFAEVYRVWSAGNLPAGYGFIDDLMKGLFP